MNFFIVGVNLIQQEKCENVEKCLSKHSWSMPIPLGRQRRLLILLFFKNLIQADEKRNYGER